MNEPSWTKGPPRSILLATDLSARSDRALDRATFLARQWRSHLTVLHVLEQQRSPLKATDQFPSWQRPPDPLGTARKNTAADLSELAETATIMVEEGETIATIMHVANTQESELIVIGVARNELLGELALGRTVDRLLRRSRVPLLVVKNRVKRPYNNIVVATDFSESSRQALLAAAHFFPEQTPTVFHAYDAPMSTLLSDTSSYRREYREIAEQDCNAFLRGTEKPGSGWQEPRILIEYGSPGQLLRDFAAEGFADLVVIGTHGRSAIFDVLIGSVAKRILNDVPCDILVVREPRASVEG